MTYLQGTIFLIKWFLTIVGIIAVSSGIVWIVYRSLPERVKNRIFEEVE